MKEIILILLAMATLALGVASFLSLLAKKKSTTKMLLTSCAATITVAVLMVLSINWGYI